MRLLEKILVEENQTISIKLENILRLENFLKANELFFLIECPGSLVGSVLDC